MSFTSKEKKKSHGRRNSRSTISKGNENNKGEVKKAKDNWEGLRTTGDTDKRVNRERNKQEELEKNIDYRISPTGDRIQAAIS